MRSPFRSTITALLPRCVAPARAGARARPSTTRSAAKVSALVLALAGTRHRAHAQEMIIPLAPVSMSTTTGEKPQSKVWLHDGLWWAVLPSSSVSPSGTWLWRLEPDHHWTNVLRLSTSTSTKADTKAIGDVTHILLHSSHPELVSIEYVPALHNYIPWRVRPTSTALSLSGSETATIDVDSAGRMWLATEDSSDILVLYSDFPYSTFEGPFVIADNVTSDDIAAVTAVPFPGSPMIGVLWSNQNTERFGFRMHFDGDNPTLWLPDEVPAEQSALHVGSGMGDDHMNLKVASDGTVYAAVKTSYNSNNFPQISFLVRRPNGHGRWEDLHFVDDEGTRCTLLFNEAENLIRVVYRDDHGDNIVYRDSLASTIGFGSRHLLIPGPLNDPTSPKMNWTDQVVVLAEGSGVLITRNLAPTTTSTTLRSSTSTTTSTTATTTSPATTTTTTLAGGVNILDVRVAASADDAEEHQAGRIDLTSSDLELVQESDLQTVGMRFAGVTIPRGARILTAWVQFQVDEAFSAATSFTLAGQASDSANPFTTTTGDISGRARTTTAIAWAPAAWPVVGAAGTDQRTPDLAPVVQEIVDRLGWSSNALAIIVTGAGKRVAKSYDGQPLAAPLLHVAYTTAGGTPPTTTTTTTAAPTTSTTLPGGLATVEVRVAASTDDAEEDQAGTIDLTSSDLELVQESTLQTVGMRFAGVAVPRGATILSAWVQFQVDEVATVATSLTLAGQAVDTAAPFTTLSRDISGRARTAAAIGWAPAGWPAIGAAGTDQRTPNLAPVIQEIVRQSGWSSGNALALIVTGTGKRVAESFDGLPGGAALLHIDFVRP